MKYMKTCSIVLLLNAPSIWAQNIVLKKTPELIAKGRASYTTNCMTCHGERGDGNGPAGAYMNPKPRNLSKGAFKRGIKPEQVFSTVSDGLDGTSMAGYSHLSADERWGLVYFVLAFRR